MNPAWGKWATDNDRGSALVKGGPQLDPEYVNQRRYDYFCTLPRALCRRAGDDYNARVQRALDQFYATEPLTPRP